jgi:hypothetical protein
MQRVYGSANAMAARCEDNSVSLREFLFSGQALARTVQRDIETAANVLVAASIELEEGEQGNDDTAELLDGTTIIGT